MGFFDQFPYYNPYQLNLDWIIAMMRKFEADYNQLDPDSFLRKSGGLVDGMLQMVENGSIDMNGKPLIGLKTAVNSGDALPFGQAEGCYMRKAGGKMSGTLDMDGHNITGLETPVSDSDAATKQYVDLKIGTPEEPGAYLPLAGGMMSGDLNMDGHALTGIQNPINGLDAVNKSYADGAYAPSGYGLGVINAKTCTDANNATVIGFYSMSGYGAINVPSGYEYGQLTVTRRNFDVYQFLLQNGIILFRQSSDGGENWEEWSFVNPPMILGVEYRTAERWNGKVVYAILIDFGLLTNSSSKSMLVSATQGATHLVRMNGVIHSVSGEYANALDNDLFGGGNISSWVSIKEGGLSVGLDNTGHNMTNQNAYIYLYYVKG